jgi:hypothetical protein
VPQLNVGVERAAFSVQPHHDLFDGRGGEGPGAKRASLNSDWGSIVDALLLAAGARLLSEVRSAGGERS